MSIYQADAVLKSCVELMIEDMKANPYLLDDVFSNFTHNPYLKKKFHTQIQNAKDWFKEVKINIELGYVNDRSELPRISIIIGPQNQDPNMSTMGDASADTVKLVPSCINKPIPLVVKPFTPASYDAPSGVLEVPDNLKNFDKAVAGQILVNTVTGDAFEILNIFGNDIFIAENSVIGDGKMAIAPQFAYWEAKVEHIWMTANYKFICTGLGDAQVAIWLHDIALYGLLRYKQGLLEALGLEESIFNSDNLTQNPNLSDAGQVAWERTISVVGKIEQTFFKAPHRLLESATLANVTGGVPQAPLFLPQTPVVPESDWTGGIQIASSSEPNTKVEEADLLWYPIEDDEP